MNCSRCGLVKDWNGDSPKCPFKSKEVFDDNWNCGIINKIRDLCAKDYVYWEDQYYATLNIAEVELDGECIGLALWVTWYKHRGRTDGMWIMDHRERPRRPKFIELEAIVNHYNKTDENEGTKSE